MSKYEVIAAVSTTEMSRYMPSASSGRRNNILPHVALTAWCRGNLVEGTWAYKKTADSPWDLVFFMFENEIDYFSFLMNWDTIFRMERVRSLKYPLEHFSMDEEYNKED